MLQHNPPWSQALVEESGRWEEGAIDSGNLLFPLVDLHATRHVCGCEAVSMAVGRKKSQRPFRLLEES